MDAPRLDLSRLSSRARQWVAWSLVVEAILLFFSSWWWEGYPRLYGDALAFDWPGQAIYAECFARGEIPLWDPYSYGGDTWLGIPVRGLFYPGFVPVVLGFWVLGAARFSAAAYAVYLVLHYVVAAAGVWLLGRRQGWTVSWAALAAVAYALGLHTITRFTVFNYLIAVVWFPFLVWQLLGFLDKPSWRRAGVWGLTLGGVFLGTAPQHDFFLTAGLTLVLLTSWHSSAAWEWRKTVLLRLVAGFLVAVGLAFAPMLYNLEYANFCKRFETPFEWVDLRAAPWWLMARAFLPCLTGYHYPVGPAVGWGESREIPDTWFHEETIYPGLTLWLGFFLFLAMRGWKDRRAWPWIALFLFGAVWACGEYNPLRVVIRWILWPIATARCPVRGWFIAQLGLSLLAVKGYIDFVREGSPIRPARRALLWLMATYGVALGIGLWRYHEVPPQPEEAAWARKLFLTTVGIQGLILLVLARRILRPDKQEKRVRIMPPALALGILLFVELYVFGTRSLQGGDHPEGMYQLPSWLAEERDRLNRDLQRMDSWEFSLRPPYWRLPTLQGNSNMSLPLSGQGLVGDFRPRGPGMDRRLDLYGVSVAMRGGGGEGAILQRRPGAFPKAWFCTRAIPAPPQQTLQLMDDPSVDLKRTVLLDPGSNIPGFFPSVFQNNVRVLSYEDNEVKLHVSTTTPGWAVLNDHFAPGWHCTVNGTPVEILRAYRLFRAVHLPAGEHDIRYWFWPDNLTRGFWLGGVSFLAGVFMLFGRALPSRGEGLRGGGCRSLSRAIRGRSHWGCSLRAASRCWMARVVSPARIWRRPRL